MKKGEQKRRRWNELLSPPKPVRFPLGVAACLPALACHCSVTLCHLNPTGSADYHPPSITRLQQHSPLHSCASLSKYKWCFFFRVALRPLLLRVYFMTRRKDSKYGISIITALQQLNHGHFSISSPVRHVGIMCVWSHFLLYGDSERRPAVLPIDCTEAWWRGKMEAVDRGCQWAGQRGNETGSEGSFWWVTIMGEAQNVSLTQQAATQFKGCNTTGKNNEFVE